MDMGEDGSKQREWAGACMTCSGNAKEPSVRGREVGFKDKKVRHRYPMTVLRPLEGLWFLP